MRPAVSFAIYAFAIGFWSLLLLRVLPAVIGAVVPFSYFMDVSKIYISTPIHEGDTKIPMSVDREIYRDFAGKFHVDIRKEQGGGFSSECQRTSGVIYYWAGEKYPPDLDLDGWLGISPNAPCKPFTEGHYYLVANWETSPWWAFGGAITHSIMSNTFTVLPKGAKS